MKKNGAKWQGQTEFSREQIEEAVRLRAKENPTLRLVISATTSTREFAKKLIFVIQIAYSIAILLIYSAECLEPSIDAALLNIWLAESILNFAVRMVLYMQMIRLPPDQLVKSLRHRLTPITTNFIGGFHWAWTTYIFIGPTLNLTTLAVFISFVLLSVASMAVAPASPLGSALYAIFLWVPMSIQLAHVDWISTGVAGLLVVGIVTVLWLSLFVVFSQILPVLDKGDEVDLLVAKLRETNRDLEGMRNEVTRELGTRSEFFSSASHDFRQRLHAMKLLTKSSLERPQLQEKNLLLKRLTDVVEDLESYIAEVLDFARIESSNLLPQKKTIALHSLFQKINLDFEEVALKQNTDLRVRSTDVQIRTDEAMLLRILENLVSNAIKFTRGRVLVAARRRGNGCLIEVWDEGPGIPPDAIGSIFRAFYQTGNRHAIDIDKGVGLGLAVVKRFIEALQYEINVYSLVGKGSVMRITIPEEDVE